ncbi:MAG: potassium-transporting ATPase subunit C [Ferruginibacter sp.]|nr:potassium-transporting ATPase subunit C [Cytophagales bacterium]
MAFTKASRRGSIFCIARVRNRDEAFIRQLVEARVEKPALGIFGMERVNVLRLNLALDGLTPEE